MKCGHLFNGIGGFALAAHWMGWENIMHCEIDPFCNQVMKKHFPNSFQHEDIRTTDFTIWRGKLDLITGGFPCQPYSTAGKRKGKDDDRHLWPQMLRAIREIQPGWIVGENVRGLTNWNGGVVFDEVQADMEAEGYEVLPFLLPACAVNAPHRRDRIWFVAHCDNRQHKYEEGEIQTGRHAVDNLLNKSPFTNSGCLFSDRREIDESEQSFNNRQNIGRKETADKFERLCTSGNVANTDNIYGRAGTGRENRKKINYNCIRWQDFPTQPPVCNRNDGLSFGLVDVAFSKWRRESIKSLGNAIVPQVAFQIFKTIEQYLVCA